MKNEIYQRRLENFYDLVSEDSTLLYPDQAIANLQLLWHPLREQEFVNSGRSNRPVICSTFGQSLKIRDPLQDWSL